MSTYAHCLSSRLSLTVYIMPYAEVKYKKGWNDLNKKGLKAVLLRSKGLLCTGRACCSDRVTLPLEPSPLPPPHPITSATSGYCPVITLGQSTQITYTILFSTAVMPVSDSAINPSFTYPMNQAEGRTTSYEGSEG